MSSKWDQFTHHMLTRFNKLQQMCNVICVQEVSERAWAILLDQGWKGFRHPDAFGVFWDPRFDLKCFIVIVSGFFYVCPCCYAGLPIVPYCYHNIF